MCHLGNKLACLPGRNSPVKIPLSVIFFFFGLPFPNEFKNGEGLQVPADSQALFSLPCMEQGNYLPGARLLDACLHR